MTFRKTPLTSEQDKAYQDLCAFLRHLLEVHRTPGQLTLHLDGIGGFDWKRVQILSFANVREFLVK